MSRTDMRSPWFYTAAAGFAGGVALRSLFRFDLAFISLVALCAAALFLYWLAKRNSGSKQRVVVLAMLLFAVLSLGTLRMHMASLRDGDPLLEEALGGEVTVEGVVIREPDERQQSTLLFVHVGTLARRDSVGMTTIDTTVLVTTSLYPRYSYGDRVVITGIMKHPEPFMTDNGRMFDYPSYLAKEGVLYTFFFPTIEVISRGEGSVIVRSLFSVKQEFLKRLERHIPEPQASLLGGLLVGTKHSLGARLHDAFRAAGLVHIIVLSGYNITIVADSVMRFCSLFFRRAVSLPAGALVVVLFAVMVGGSATVVRASLMALLALFAQATRHRYDITRALFVAALLMLVHNPRILLFDPSFQLSFLATFALIVVTPLVESYARFITERWHLRETIVATLATQLFVLPLLLYMTGMLPLLALPANILVLPLIPFTMLVGFLAGVGGFVHDFIGLPFAWISYGLLSYIIAVVRITASLPFATLAVPAFSPLFLIGVYWFYAFILARKKKSGTESGLAV